MRNGSILRQTLRKLTILTLTGAMAVTFPACQPSIPGGPGLSVVSTPASDDQLPDGEELRQLLDEALEITCQGRQLTLKDHAAWQIVHGALAFGRDFPVVDSQGRLVSSMGHVLGGGKMTGWEMEPGGEYGNPPRRGLRAVIAPGSITGQGHADQWLGYLADCGFKLEDPIVWDGTTYQIADIVAQVEQDVPYNALQEYSWTLMGLTAYHPTSHEWTAGDGQKWNIERLLEIELNHDLGQSACGGSHRMAGVVMALNRHVAAGGKLEGVWKAADEKVRVCVETARRYQNPDGSLSSNWFQRPGSSPDFKEALGTTGHVFEFVVLSVSDDDLRDPWIRRSAVYLCNLLKKTSQVDLECGALYHAAHGLVVYRRRLYGDRSYLPEGIQKSLTPAGAAPAEPTAAPTAAPTAEPTAKPDAPNGTAPAAKPEPKSSDEPPAAAAEPAAPADASDPASETKPQPEPAKPGESPETDELPKSDESSPAPPAAGDKADDADQPDGADGATEPTSSGPTAETAEPGESAESADGPRAANSPDVSSE